MNDTYSFIYNLSCYTCPMDREARHDEEQRLIAYYQLLERSARSILGGRVDLYHRIEDYVQETLLLYINKASALTGHGNVEGWLFVTLRNLIWSDLKREGRSPRAYSLDDAARWGEPRDEGADVEGELIAREEMEQIRAIAGLDNYRLLKRYYGEGLSAGTLAQETGVGENALRVRLHRLKAKIKERLEK